MTVHIGSDEKFSSGLFVQFEFLHSLQVVFQFINTTSLQSCPLPTSSDEVINLSSFPCIYFHSKNCSYKIVEAVKFSFS